MYTHTDNLTLHFAVAFLLTDTELSHLSFSIFSITCMLDCCKASTRLSLDCRLACSAVSFAVCSFGYLSLHSRLFCMYVCICVCTYKDCSLQLESHVVCCWFRCYIQTYVRPYIHAGMHACIHELVCPFPSCLSVHVFM
jgi:hypothetical protein